MNKLKLSTFIVLIFLVSFVSAKTLTYDLSENNISMTYDAGNRILTKGNIIYSYENDTLSNITNTDVSIKYEYDNRKRVVKETKEIDGITFEKEISYDSQDKITKINDVNYTYGDDYNVNSIYGILNSTYNENSQVEQRIYENELVSNLDYDLENFRLNQIETSNLQNITYIFDNVSNVIAIVSNLNNYSMSYDKLNRIHQVNITDDKNFIYEFNSIGNLISVTEDEDLTNYIYGTMVHTPTQILSMQPSIDFIFPLNQYNDVDGIVQFNCLVGDDTNLANVTLYGTWDGGWHADEVKTVSGTSELVSFSKQLEDGEYAWGCLVYNSNGKKEWSENQTFFVFNTSLKSPSITLDIRSSSVLINWTKSVANYGSFVTYFLEYTQDNGQTWNNIVKKLGLIDEFSDGSKIKTLEFVGSETKVVYLKIPKNAIVTDADINWEVIS